ncbi:flavoprotein [Streptomyces sp. ODS05-4]|uniref:flavoprotein n=1 Tax=Streptomyces sp. ODS05-4 TaxID=2944939 RepID=UPI00210C62B0|nr:flavoprotein [Streptomyces sp. ODS05-4]
MTVREDLTPAAGRPLLGVVVCGAGNAGKVGTLLLQARRRGWETMVIATPAGLGFLDRAAVEAATGRPVRSAWRLPGEERPPRDPDALAVAPATFNTVNKWAAGIADTLALGVLCGAYGKGLPTAVLPAVGPDLAAHPAYARSLEALRTMGVLVGGGGAFRWGEALDLLEPARVRLGGGRP